MMHWNHDRNNAPSGYWRDSCVIGISDDSCERIDHFAKAIIGAVGADTKKFRPRWYPGVVITIKAYNQVAHVDIPDEYQLFEEGKIAPEELSWIIHVPLQQSGSMIGVWSEDKQNHDYQYIPFGCFLAIRSDVIHSGVYGFPGNVRFHMVIKLKHLKPGPEKLRTFKGEAVDPDPFVHWDSKYIVHMNNTQPFRDFYTDYFLRCFPTLNIVDHPNYLGNLDKNDVGLGESRIIGEEGSD